jgi:hypothetical protein
MIPGSILRGVYPATLAMVGSTIAAHAVEHKTQSEVEKSKAEYVLVEELKAFARDSSFVAIPMTVLRISRPEMVLYDRFAGSSAAEYQLDESTIKVLGVRSFRRLQNFQRLQAGWSFGTGLAMSTKSLANMENFLKGFSTTLFEELGHPLIFLNRDGEIEITWKKGSDREVFLRFHETNVDYLVSPGDLEGTENTEAAGRLIQAAINSELAA